MDRPAKVTQTLNFDLVSQNSLISRGLAFVRRKSKLLKEFKRN